MRTIKFRAWDTVESKMRFEALEIKDIGLGEGSVVASEEVQTDNPLKWMQFTGLLDKSGKEIYEGDVIDGRRYYRPALYGRRVVPEMAPDNAYALGELNRWHDVVKVIGNRFENPELLNPNN